MCQQRRWCVLWVGAFRKEISRVTCTNSVVQQNICSMARGAWQPPPLGYPPWLPGRPGGWRSWARPSLRCSRLGGLSQRAWSAGALACEKIQIQSSQMLQGTFRTTGFKCIGLFLNCSIPYLNRFSPLYPLGTMVRNDLDLYASCSGKPNALEKLMSRACFFCEPC